VTALDDAGFSASVVISWKELAHRTGRFSTLAHPTRLSGIVLDSTASNRYMR
jgi:hypothetical protein